MSRFQALITIIRDSNRDTLRFNNHYRFLITSVENQYAQFSRTLDLISSRLEAEIRSDEYLAEISFAC